MPQNGDINEKFGIYKSVCCDVAIVISEGVTFPDCPKHINLATEWKMLTLTDDRIPHITEFYLNRKRADPAA